MVPKSVSRKVMETQIEAASSWAQRKKDVELDYSLDQLTLRLTMSPRLLTSDLILSGEFDGYPVLPPKWCLTNPEGENVVNSLKPSSTKKLPEGGTIFHGSGYLCVPFNRLAYGNIHKDWTDTSAWKNTALQHIHAEQISEMLAAFYSRLCYCEFKK